MSAIDKTKKIQNDHADEEVIVDGGSSVPSSERHSDGEGDEGVQDDRIGGGVGGKSATNQITVQGAYEPAQYSNLPVSAELKQLFKTIQRYVPPMIELQTKLKAFIPQYIPAIGQVDAFLKMPRPDNQPEILGLEIMDQPSLNQSDKAKIDLQLINNNKQYRGGKYNKVHSIQNAENNPKQILSWISSVGDIHKSKQPPSVSYSKRMPDIDSLMQVWPQEVEDLLSQVSAPSQEIDLSITDYSKIACNILDIPVHSGTNNSLVQSLHVVFTLYSAFKQNQHFNVNQENESFAEHQR